jgi:hypothetical protein
MDFAACGMLIKDVRAILHDHFMCSNILLVPRECNSAAHNLDSLSLGWDLGESFVWTSPLLKFVMNLVSHDVVELPVIMRRPWSHGLE